MKDDRLYLIHITECIGRIERYTAAGEAEFLQDEKTQDAVVRNLQTMAQSTKRISPALKAAHPEVGWQDVSDFRNVLVHEYLKVNLPRIWEILQNELPNLKQKVSQMLAELG